MSEIREPKYTTADAAGMTQLQKLVVALRCEGHSVYAVAKRLQISPTAVRKAGAVGSSRLLSHRRQEAREVLQVVGNRLGNSDRSPELDENGRVVGGRPSMASIEDLVEVEQAAFQFLTG